ncbi:uncharacterized protein BJ171DRAFT_235926 [Polychytrium aggregatum]|uniref:uncharacterized protein n=1 Tax=Polychytrium aggregatum TaxID=110093 RepID=UPI0022FEBD99|nr:uncharacterized protein BJ171DRAFT_235926 [Polychytrium aggregatum]KAI9208184.1 hypothetical protein BJ171DRAFT_235926 [Polychytrium aggregatum]
MSVIEPKVVAPSSEPERSRSPPPAPGRDRSLSIADTPRFGLRRGLLGVLGGVRNEEPTKTTIPSMTEMHEITETRAIGPSIIKTRSVGVNTLLNADVEAVQSLRDQIAKAQGLLAKQNRLKLRMKEELTGARSEIAELKTELTRAKSQLAQANDKLARMQEVEEELNAAKELLVSYKAELIIYKEGHQHALDSIVRRTDQQWLQVEMDLASVRYLLDHPWAPLQEDDDGLGAFMPPRPRTRPWDLDSDWDSDVEDDRDDPWWRNEILYDGSMSTLASSAAKERMLGAQPAGAVQVFEPDYGVIVNKPINPKLEAWRAGLSGGKRRVSLEAVNGSNHSLGTSKSQVPPQASSSVVAHGSSKPAQPAPAPPAPAPAPAQPSSEVSAQPGLSTQATNQPRPSAKAPNQHKVPILKAPPPPKRQNGWLRPLSIWMGQLGEQFAPPAAGNEPVTDDDRTAPPKLAPIPSMPPQAAAPVSTAAAPVAPVPGPGPTVAFKEEIGQSTQAPSAPQPPAKSSMRRSSSRVQLQIQTDFLNKKDPAVAATDGAPPTKTRDSVPFQLTPTNNPPSAATPETVTERRQSKQLNHKVLQKVQSNENLDTRTRRPSLNAVGGGRVDPQALRRKSSIGQMSMTADSTLWEAPLTEDREEDDAVAAGSNDAGSDRVLKKRNSTHFESHLLSDLNDATGDWNDPNILSALEDFLDKPDLGESSSSTPLSGPILQDKRVAAQRIAEIPGTPVEKIVNSSNNVMFNEPQVASVLNTELPLASKPPPSFQGNVFGYQKPATEQKSNEQAAVPPYLRPRLSLDDFGGPMAKPLMSKPAVASPPKAKDSLPDLQSPFGIPKRRQSALVKSSFSSDTSAATMSAASSAGPAPLSLPETRLSQTKLETAAEAKPTLEPVLEQPEPAQKPNPAAGRHPVIVRTSTLVSKQSSNATAVEQPPLDEARATEISVELRAVEPDPVEATASTNENPAGKPPLAIKTDIDVDAPLQNGESSTTLEKMASALEKTLETAIENPWSIMGWLRTPKPPPARPNTVLETGDADQQPKARSQ